VPKHPAGGVYQGEDHDAEHNQRYANEGQPPDASKCTRTPSAMISSAEFRSGAHQGREAFFCDLVRFETDGGAVLQATEAPVGRIGGIIQVGQAIERLDRPQDAGIIDRSGSGCTSVQRLTNDDPRHMPTIPAGDA
jgi:hypothetical protein